MNQLINQSIKSLCPKSAHTAGKLSPWGLQSPKVRAQRHSNGSYKGHIRVCQTLLSYHISALLHSSFMVERVYKLKPIGIIIFYNTGSDKRWWSTLGWLHHNSDAHILPIPPSRRPPASCFSRLKVQLQKSHVLMYILSNKFSQLIPHSVMWPTVG